MLRSPTVRPDFVPHTIFVPEGTDVRDAPGRGNFTASSAAAKTGADRDSTPQQEYIKFMENKPETDPVKLSYFEEGHRMEEPVAQRAARILFPYQELLTPEHGNGLLDEHLIYVDPEYKYITSWPDRSIVGHPSPRTKLEIKYSRHSLAIRPKTSHLFQCEVQMRTTGTPFMWLAYGHMDDCVAVFLIQECPELWTWIAKRAAIWNWHVNPPPPQKPTPIGYHELPAFGHAVDDYWGQKQKKCDWVRHKFPNQCVAIDFWPVQPRWIFYGCSFNPDRLPRYFQNLELSSPTGPVTDAIFQSAVGGIWNKIGVGVTYDLRDTREMLFLGSCHDSVIIDALLHDKKEQEPQREIIEGIIADYIESPDQRAFKKRRGVMDPALFSVAHLDAVKPLVDAFLREQPANWLHDGSSDYDKIRDFANWMRTRHPILSHLIDNLDQDALYSFVSRHVIVA